jgi:hypothetical protein
VEVVHLLLADYDVFLNQAEQVWCGAGGDWQGGQAGGSVCDDMGGCGLAGSGVEVTGVDCRSN